MNDTFWRRFFVFCGVFNLVVGGIMALAPNTLAAMSGLPLPAGDFLFVRMAGLLVAVFGVGYLMVANDIDRHRGIVVLGVIGKTAVALLFLIYWLNETITFRAFLAGFADLIFVAFFVRFLRRYAAR